MVHIDDTPNLLWAHHARLTIAWSHPFRPLVATCVAEPPAQLSHAAPRVGIQRCPRQLQGLQQAAHVRWQALELLEEGKLPASDTVLDGESLLGQRSIMMFRWMVCVYA